MKKKSIVNFFHYFTKSLIILFPIIILCLSLLVDGYSGDMFNELSSFMSNIYNLPMSNFYSQTLNTLGFTDINLNTYLGYILYMPLWIFWVYMIDLLLDFMLFIPKIAHKWLDKGYGAE